MKGFREESGGAQEKLDWSSVTFFVCRHLWISHRDCHDVLSWQNLVSKNCCSFKWEICHCECPSEVSCYFGLLVVLSPRILLSRRMRSNWQRLGKRRFGLWRVTAPIEPLGCRCRWGVQMQVEGAMLQEPGSHGAKPQTEYRHTKSAPKV